MRKYVLLFGLLIGFAFAALAQQQPLMPVKKSKADSIQARKDSVRSKPFVPKITADKAYYPDSNHSPNKAWHRSVMIPGWGQIYNHKWWKVPLIYAGLGAAGYFYVTNQSYYTESLAIAHYRETGSSPKIGDKYYDTYQLYQKYGYPDQSVYDEVRYYRRNRDLTVFLFVLGWGVQTIDAYIDAKFMHSYSMDNNFTLKVGPSVINSPVYAGNYYGSIIPGLKFTFTL